jgi:hypothetical protein
MSFIMTLPQLLSSNAMITFAFERPDLRPRLRNCYQIRPGSRVVTSCTIQVLPSGSLKEQKDP